MTNNSLIWWRKGWIALLLCTQIGCSTDLPQPKPNPPIEGNHPTIHLLRTDEQGKLTDLDKLKEYAKDIKEKNITDVYFIAHGWNNSEEDARGSYSRSAEQVHKIAKGPPDLRPDNYKPFVLGIIWPSKAWEKTPTPESVRGALLSQKQIEALDASFPKEKADSEAQRKADLQTIKQLAKKPNNAVTEDDRKKAFAIFNKYATTFNELKFPTHDDRHIFAAPVTEGANLIPEGAFGGIRDVARVFTFWQMKERAGIVGENGGAEILKAIREKSPSVRIHLFGHSFGSKLVLSAVKSAAKTQPAMKVNTVVLIQAAISHQAMAERVTGIEPPTQGGYRDVLNAVNGPIVATFSNKDVPLKYAYPLGARLAGQTGELESVSRYSALGAIGFDNVNSKSIKAQGELYGFTNEAKLHSIASSTVIGGHSDISDIKVAWLHWASVMRK